MDDFPPEDSIVLGGPLSRLSVSVRVAGDQLNPAEITRLFGVVPKFSAAKGEQRPSGSRTVTQRIGIWTYGLSDEPSPEWELDDAIATLFQQLPSDLALWNDLARRFKLDVFCGLFMGSDNQGADLRPSTLKLLADRGLTLSLDIYGPPPDDAAT